jgi:DNA-directed RNA polymerase specialized sigma24 family protein
MSPDEDAAFVVFARERARPLFRTALLLTGGDWHRAEDLVQETLLRLYRFWPRVQPAANPAGYAYAG